MNATGKRQFPHVAAWGDSAGYYAVMPIEFRKEDCYILLDSLKCCKCSEIHGWFRYRREFHEVQILST